MRSHRTLLCHIKTLCKWNHSNGCWKENGFHRIIAGQIRFMSYTSDCHSDVSQFNLKKVVLMKKVTRYEYEKHNYRDQSEEKFRELLDAKGSDYTGLLQRYDEYQASLENIIQELVKRNIEYKVIRSFDQDTGLVDWCDAIITAGGDGTFLNAASMVQSQSKPVIGINTDPMRSEGYLCLPKSYTSQVGLALDKMINGEFQWKWRQRIRMTLSGASAYDVPLNLHSQQMDFPEHRFWEHVKENEEHNNAIRAEQRMLKPTRILPILALNEVFVGESLSARVSFYELSIDGSERVKQKSSGLTLCTGTGSTSWFFNINHITEQSVKKILNFAQELGVCQNAAMTDNVLLKKLTNKFNNSLTFQPSVKSMAYCVRDPIRNAVFSVENEKGFCTRTSIKSRMWDGWIVVDGGLSFKFNNGAICEFEMKPADALRCIHLN